MFRKAYGKINLCLDVLSKREDSYHNIDTVMAKISLYDEMNFQKISSGIKIEGSFDFNPEENLIYKAWRSLCQYTKKDLGLYVKVKKNIPTAAGLAGGTANGAMILNALNDLYHLKISEEEMQKISLKLGADFPFMMQKKNKRARGVGEILSPAGDFYFKKVLLINPGYGISTPSVYKKIKITEDRIDIDGILRALNERDFNFLRENLKNKMEDVVFKDHRDLRLIKDRLSDFGGISLMSGSGASIFSIFENEKDLEEAYEFFAPSYKYVFRVEVGENCGSI
ncbi:4-(cytidine 5'-diphospho)-2-C-methyl-D-erythritol kinase [Peptoniphilus raoultii]|uniref:4-(cytidine 5'-diphospho)-2-C-methyl-D-erythritol kinase n=1 Tax=Peptoniphilus raoultii TaxID=1776387 RepID=UPI0008DA2AFB|nr:4-(cytidine 5'-diphospho)-2-C-methyl-D-erythritol kinase [Peptoniphilus raoultii]